MVRFLILTQAIIAEKNEGGPRVGPGVAQIIQIANTILSTEVREHTGVQEEGKDVVEGGEAVGLSYLYTFSPKGTRLDVYTYVYIKIYVCMYSIIHNKYHQ
jgi:hypothetical protein